MHWPKIHLPPGYHRNQRIVRPMLPPGVMGQWEPPNLLVDGDCEDVGVAAWEASNCTLTKTISSPYEGLRAIRIINTATHGNARQQVLQIGKTYRITGVGRSVDGVSEPWVYVIDASPGPIVWQGTTSTAWQPFDATFTVGGATDNRLRIYSVGSSGLIADFDDLYLWEP